ncbi:MAG: TPM domain-containing protein [Chthoniobacterales bacterium]
MKPKHLHAKLDDARIVAAIADAESKTTGRIHIFISHRHLGKDDVMQRARARFEKLRLTSTEAHNTILIYLLPHEQKFAILGDSGIHEKCGAECWNALAEQMRNHLVREEFAEAILDTIQQAGQLLATHFPQRPL